MAKKMSIGLQVNCCYARVAIFELSKGSKGKARAMLDIKDVTRKFQELFASDNFLIESAAYWDKSFERHLNHTLDCFSKAWYPYELRNKYISSFSIGKWHDLSPQIRSQHTMSNCLACAKSNLDLQNTFPAQPCFAPSNIVTVAVPMDGTSEGEVTRTVFRELNQTYRCSYKRKFVDSAIKNCGKVEGIERRKSPLEKKKEKRKWQRKFRDVTNQQFPISSSPRMQVSLSLRRMNRSQVISENGYHNPLNSKKILNPLKIMFLASDTKLSCYRDIVLEKVSSWPEDKIINWSELARQCQIQGKNRGQIAKSIAEKNGVPASRLTSIRKKACRRYKAKLPGKEVSVPCMPTPALIKADINSLIETGQLHLGEPCSPFTLVKSDGVVEHKKSVVYGRKIPLSEIRRNLITKQEKFMHLLRDEEIGALTYGELQSYISRDEELDASDSLDNLRSQLR